jgi:hypothetical protein
MLSEGVTTDPEKLKAVQEWPILTDKHELRSFLGLCTYYRWFISSFANIAKLLTRLTEEKQAFQWSLEVEAAFQSLKEALCIAPILGYPQPGEKFIIDTDVINVRSGVLSQVRNRQEWVTAYYSKIMDKTERNYCITQQEVLAIVRILEHFCKYLYREEFHLHTDHSALIWLMSFKNLER